MGGIPKQTDQAPRFLAELFLRAPYYSVHCYDPARLPELLTDAYFRQALHLASPVFYTALEKKQFDWPRLSPAERHSLLKYFNRMCFRPTPFGAFATYSLAEWSASGQTHLAPDASVRILAVPDRKLMAVPAPLADAELLRVNPLLYRLGDDYRLVHSAADAGGKYRFSVHRLAAEAFYTELFKQLKSGPRTVADILAWMTSFAGCNAEEALQQLAQLLDEQVLLREKKGSPIGGASLMNISGTIPARQCYAAAERPLTCGGPSFTDRTELEQAVGALQRLALPLVPLALQNFISDFRARFDRQSVPLLLALDPDAGIIYDRLAGSAAVGMDILAGIDFPPAPKQGKDLIWTPVHRLLFSLWNGADPITLTDKDLTALGDPGNIPVSSSVLFRQAATHLVIEHAGEPHASGLIGRFSLFSPKVGQLCRDLAAIEIAANPELLYADIGAWSDEHVDNVNLRERIYPYQIPLNVFAGREEAEILSPEDLMLSVAGEELILFSLSRKKRVIPRLTTAYNYRHNELGIFRLLCDLQYQGVSANLTLDMEALFPGLDFYPRVVYGRVVLSLAKWKLTGTQREALLSGESPEGLALPRHISMGTHDRQLVFDLTDPSEKQFFLDCLEKQERPVLQEYLPAGRQVKKGFEPLAGQFVGFLHYSEALPMASLSAPPVANAQATRSYSLGTQWLYLKFFCTPASADQVLTSVIAPVLKRFGKFIHKWFFIRYHEGGDHLRLRINLSPEGAGPVLEAFGTMLRKPALAHLVREMQGDTYRRELERYPPEIIGMVEDLFWHSSRMVLDHVLKPSLGEFGAAIASADRLVRVFLPARADRTTFYQERVRDFEREFRAGKPMRVALDRKLRALRPQLASALGAETLKFEKEIELTLLALAQATGSWSASRRHILLADLLHMHLNRAISAEERKQEMLICFCLYRQCLSESARNAS